MKKTIVFTTATLPRAEHTGRRGRAAIDWNTVIVPLLKAAAGSQVRVSYGSSESAQVRASQLRSQLSADTFKGVETLWIGHDNDDVVITVDKKKVSSKK